MKKTINRAIFIRNFMDRGGLTYLQSIQAYEAMTGTIENAVVNGDKVSIGRVCCLSPEFKDPREIHMGFVRKGGKIEKIKRTYYVGGRVSYKVKIHRKFRQTHQLGWFNENQSC